MKCGYVCEADLDKCSGKACRDTNMCQEAHGVCTCQMVCNHVYFCEHKRSWRFGASELTNNSAFDRKSHETIYILFICPILEYDRILFHNRSIAEEHDIESNQQETAELATDKIKYVI